MSVGKQIDTQVLNSWVSLVETLTENSSYFHLKVPDYVTCVGISTKGQVPLVKQNRFPLGRESIELPGGLVDTEITPLECAKNELLEEVGISETILLHAFPPFILDSGRIENQSWIFVFEISENDSLISEPGIEVIWVGIPELIDMALTAKIDHLGHIAAVMMCKQLKFFDKYLAESN